MQSADKFTYIRALNGADLTLAEYRVLITVWHYTDKDGQRAYASAARLAQDCRMAERTARRSLAGLVQKGFLHRVRRGGRDAQPRASEYELRLPDHIPTGHHRPDGGKPTGQQRPVGDDPTGHLTTANRPFDDGQPATGVTPTEPDQNLEQKRTRARGAAAHRSEADALVRCALSNGYPDSTIKDLTAKTAAMLARGDPSELVRRALELWDAKPDAGVGLLPHLIAEAAKSARPPIDRRSTRRPSASTQTHSPTPPELQ